MTPQGQEAPLESRRRPVTSNHVNTRGLRHEVSVAQQQYYRPGRGARRARPGPDGDSARHRRRHGSHRHRHPPDRNQGGRQPGADPVGRFRGLETGRSAGPDASPGPEPAVVQRPAIWRGYRRADPVSGAARPQSQPDPAAGRRQAPQRHRQPAGRWGQSLPGRSGGGPELHSSRFHRAHRSAPGRRSGPVRVRRYCRGCQYHPQKGRPWRQHLRHGGTILRRGRRHRIPVAQQGFQHRRQWLLQRHRRGPCSRFQPARHLRPALQRPQRDILERWPSGDRQHQCSEDAGLSQDEQHLWGFRIQSLQRHLQRRVQYYA